MSGKFIYYVYAYLDGDGIPYYIGKGQGKRAHRKHTNVTTPKNPSQIIILEKNLSEVGSLALERRYIRWYGRRTCGTGPLLNRTSGGEGTDGYKQTYDHVEKRIAHRRGVPGKPSNIKQHLIEASSGERFVVTDLTAFARSHSLSRMQLWHTKRTGKYNNGVRLIQNSI